MQKVIDALDELIKLADINDVYLLDSFQYNSACFVGRQDDLEEINELLAKNQLVFLSGIGGLARQNLQNSMHTGTGRSMIPLFSQYMRKI